MGPDREQYLDLTQFDKEDPALKYIEQETLAGRGREKHVKDWKGSVRHFALIMVENKFDEGPFFYNFTPTLKKSIEEIAIDENGDVRFIDDPDEGCWITFTANSSTLDNGNTIPKYEHVKLDQRNTKLFKDYANRQRFLNRLQTNPLTSYLNLYSYEHLDKKYQGQLAMLHGAKDEKPKPQSKPRPQAQARAPQPEPEEIDDPNIPRS